ncbi:MAG: NAD(P)-dependent oxidoreductase [Chloroflexi bacterium]|nr:NAD(P)-dependent oxidoreductase [Chloroflexota bacterium]
MAIVVTGGGGYIGRWLANELSARGERVIAVDRLAPDPAWEPRLPANTLFVEGDVSDRGLLIETCRREPVSAIIHLAGIVTMGCERDPDLGMKVNLGGTHNALEAARVNSVARFVFASTISVYGPDVPQPITEDVPALPLTWYGQSKIMAEQLGLYYQRRYGVDFRAARMAAIVGSFRNAASGSATMYTSLILERAALGQPYAIDVGEDAATPVCYVKDAARALATLALAPSAPRRIYNIGTGRASAVDLVEIARRRVPEADLTFAPEPALAAVARISYHWDLSIKAAEEDLGWTPAYSLDSMADDLMATVRAGGHG